ncbi:MAG: hypothetical protein OHK0053_23120 [Microscillaceae bacterium]
MNNKIISVSVLMVWLSLMSFSVFAQLGPQGFNPNSVRPILEDDIMYRKTIWRKINLLEKQNKPFFSSRNEITQVILEAVEQRKVQPFVPTSDPRKSGFDDEDQMEYEECVQKMKSYYDPNFGDSVIIRPSELYQIEIKEDLVFDRRRSLMYWDIQAITIVMPQGTTPDTQMGELPIATFRFKDLYDYFNEAYKASLEKGPTEDLRAFWYNPDNPKRHVSLSDAFDLRLFSSRIFKVANPDDNDIGSIINNEYGADNPETAKKILYESQKIEYDLREFEHNLWEF